MSRKRHIPPWTHNAWVDEGPARQEGDWPLQGFMDRLRPALLPSDEDKNPTPYARRFGIYPGRTDGRSRTSPTRAGTRATQFMGSGESVHKVMTDWARSKGRNLDDFLIDDRPDTNSESTLDEQMAMHAFNELLVNENWQSCLFGDMTMDELQAGDIFSMDNAPFSLQGPLNPLLTRDRWGGVANPQLYPNAHRGGYHYNIDGKSGELNAKTDDAVWRVLQPALLLVTKLLEADDSFIRALKDIRNRSIIEPPLDKRPANQVAKRPWHKFSLKPERSEVLGAASGTSPSPGFSSSVMVDSDMTMLLRFKLGSGHYTSKSGRRVKGCPELGHAYTNSVLNFRSPITISLSGELVWPLLAEKYSNSEKLMMSYIIAVTLLHEIMHAIQSIHVRYLCQPDYYYVIVNEQDTRYCERVVRELYGPRPPPYLTREPYFEDQPVSEVGYAYESHALGGTTWPLFRVSLRPIPAFIGSYGGIGTCHTWPTAHLSDENGRLSEPPMLYDNFRTNAQHSVVQQFFSENFWQTSVRRYGMAALREPLSRPSKAWCSPNESRHFMKQLRGCNLGSVEDRRELVNYIGGLQKAGYDVTAHYLLTLCFEVGRFENMIHRFAQLAATWDKLSLKIFALCLRLFAVAFEVEARAALTRRNVTTKQKQDEFNRCYHNFIHVVKLPFEVDPGTRRCLGSKSRFMEGVMQGDPMKYAVRLEKILMEICVAVESECSMQESMVCNLYELPRFYWTHYQKAMLGHEAKWVSYTTSLLRHLRKVSSMMQSMPISVPFWHEKGQARIQSLITSFDNISALVAGNNNDVYSNWRDMLTTVPMLRKSRRKPYETWFAFAKHEMLQFTGSELTELSKFKDNFTNLLNLSTYKVIFPDSDKGKQGMAERWAGLLDDSITSLERSKELLDALQEPEGSAIAAQLEADKDGAERRSQQGATDRVRLAQITRQELAAKMASAPPTGAPQVTDPMVRNHPTPLSGNQQPGSSSSRPVGEAARSAYRLATEANLPTPNLFAPAGRSQLVVPRPYDIDEGVTGDLMDKMRAKELREQEMKAQESRSLTALQSLGHFDRKNKQTAKEARELCEAMMWDQVFQKRAIDSMIQWREPAAEAAAEEKVAALREKIAKRKRGEDDTAARDGKKKKSGYVEGDEDEDADEAVDVCKKTFGRRDSVATDESDESQWPDI